MELDLDVSAYSDIYAIIYSSSLDIFHSTIISSETVLVQNKLGEYEYLFAHHILLAFFVFRDN